MIRIGVICPSEIAFRRFLPAISKSQGVKYVGVAIANEEEWLINNPIKLNEVLTNEYKKAQTFVNTYGGNIYKGYKNFIQSDDIDAVYLPLPPALHYEWAKLALKSGKHVFVEKPFTTNLTNTMELIELAKEKGLALHENYMFAFHRQLNVIENIIKKEQIGDVRLYRIAFGFPRRSASDFRYNKSLGGGALLDCGGYTIKYSSMLLGDSAKISCANLNYLNEFDVDIYGSATMVNDDGITVQLSFGMDNNYKCELEVWGSKGTLYTGRVLTAPAGFEPELILKIGNEEPQILKLPEDDSFLKSINKFIDCVNNENIRKENYDVILRQARFVDEFLSKLNN